MADTRLCPEEVEKVLVEQATKQNEQTISKVASINIIIIKFKEFGLQKCLIRIKR